MMFEHLARFRKIVVTGPQRSGTSICARMAAFDTGHEYIDEDRFGVDKDALFWGIVETPVLQVVQAPGMCHMVDELAPIDDVFVIFMERAPEDIIASQERIQWDGEASERRKYGVSEIDKRPVCKIKHHVWTVRQKDRLMNNGRGLTMVYERLSSHWMWIPREKRRNFGPRQWRLE